MINKFQVNAENLFINKKYPSSNLVEQSQTDKKSIRTLQLIFQMNLNKFTRKNKQAFGGALDVPLNRPALTKQQYQSNKKVLDNIDQYMDRLIKSMTIRNNYLEKQLKSFDQSYRQSIGSSILQNPQRISKKENQQQSTVLMVCQNSWEGSNSKLNFSKYQTTPSRPFSATVQNRSIELKRFPSKLTARPMSSQLSKQIRQRNIMNIKNIDLHKTKIQKQSKKVPLFRQSLGQISDYQRYVQEQVYIRKKIIPDKILEGENKFMKGSSAYYSRKGQRPSLINRYKNVVNSKEYINQMQRVKLQNKIMMVNTVLAFNLNQTQGYKPKSKCWSNNFI